MVCNFPDSARPLLRRFIKKVRRHDQDRAVVRGVVGTQFADVFLEGCSLEGVTAADGSATAASTLFTPVRAETTALSAAKRKRAGK